MQSVRAIVHGIVQGVGFRYHTQRVAQQLGVTGYVRNLADGRVEIVAVGPETSVDALLTWAHQGPGSAQVTQVEVTPYDGSPSFDGFTIER
ncbi:MAG TPA: acylphosphatase [Leptolyngbyaceae cyanobacterium M65_K2018_010]|nr:acylphosphatase [Leptolyngbyaceae cyanobacterium M65_K2018_010]